MHIINPGMEDHAKGSWRGEKFSSTLLVSVYGGLHIKITKEINRRKGTQLLLIFMCIGVHRKEKLKKVVRLGAYRPFLTKERAFGPQGMINHGEVAG